jgi:hypothetical protein
MNAELEVTRLLRDSGAVLIRENNHEVYRLPNGKNFVKAKTGSDHRGALNSLSDLRRTLGVERPANEQPPLETPAPTHAGEN